MFEFDLQEAAQQIGLLVISFLLALPIGWDREQRDRSMGVRTFPLVAVASCAFVLVAQARLDDEHAVSRVIQGVIVGIGFLGGGAIVKQAGLVRGAATAAAVWTTAALGVAVAARALAIAVFLALLGFGTLRWLRLLRRTAVNGREAGDEAEAAAEPRPRSPPPPP